MWVLSLQTGTSPDERESKSKVLLERLKKVEAENSALVLENETQRQQYEKCLDEIANQVRGLCCPCRLEHTCLEPLATEEFISAANVRLEPLILCSLNGGCLCLGSLSSLGSSINIVFL